MFRTKLFLMKEAVKYIFFNVLLQAAFIIINY